MTKIRVRGVNHITLAVRDLRRSIHFYRELLGFDLRARWPDGAYLEAGQLWLCLSVDAAVSESVRADYTHMALDVREGDIDAFARRLQGEGGIWKENRSEGASLYILDPDGHKLELHAGSLSSRLAHYRRNPRSGMELFD